MDIDKANAGSREMFLLDKMQKFALRNDGNQGKDLKKREDFPSRS